MKTMATLPRHVCRHCKWLRKTGVRPWGMCRLHGESKWYQNASCEEYEMDSSVPDKI